MWFASQVTALLLRNRASVNYAEFFRAPCRKNYALGQKRIKLLWWARRALSPREVWGTSHNARAVGPKIWCLFLFYLFVCWSRSESGAPCVRGVHSSNKHCVAVYCPISTRFSAFFRRLLLLQLHYIVFIFVARWRHNFREIAVKNWEKSKKSAEKFLRTTSYR